MTPLEVTALCLVAAWLGGLSIAVLALLREVALLNVAVRTTAQDATSTYGPLVGHMIAKPMRDAIPRLDVGVSYLLFTSATCGACVDIVRDLDSYELDDQLVPVVGGRDQLTEDFMTMFPQGMPVIRDPVATELANELNVMVSPLVVEIDSGVVTGKSFLRNAGDLWDLLEAREHSEAAEIAIAMRRS